MRPGRERRGCCDRSRCPPIYRILRDQPVAMTMGGRMVGRTKLTDEDTVELQRLYSELPSAIAEAAEALQQQRSGQSSPEALREGDEKVDTIIKRICQLTEDPEAN